jgi:hypothetical protein
MKNLQHANSVVFSMEVHNTEKAEVETYGIALYIVQVAS